MDQWTNGPMDQCTNGPMVPKYTQSTHLFCKTPHVMHIHRNTDNLDLDLSTNIMLQDNTKPWGSCCPMTDTHSRKPFSAN